MLRTVKLFSFVAMLFVALSASAQVATSALSDVNQQALIDAATTTKNTSLNVEINRNAPDTVGVSCIDHGPHNIGGIQMLLAESRSVNALDESLDNNQDEISQENHLQIEGGDGILKELLWVFLLLIGFILLSFVFIIAIIKGKDIMIKYSDFKMEILSKQGKEE